MCQHGKRAQIAKRFQHNDVLNRSNLLHEDWVKDVISKYGLGYYGLSVEHRNSGGISGSQTYLFECRSFRRDLHAINCEC